MNRFAILIVLVCASTAHAQNPPIRLRAPGGGFIGMQFQASNIANLAGQMANETALLFNTVQRTPVSAAVKNQLIQAGQICVTKTQEVQVLANRPATRDIIYRTHQEADLAVTNWLAMIQQSGAASRELAQAVSRVQYADAQLEQAFSGIGGGGGGEDQWRRRVSQMAKVLSDQADELRAIAGDSLTAFDRNLDRAIRQFAAGCDGVERNVQSGAAREKIVADVTELSRRWQTVTAGLKGSLTANAAVRAQATRVDSLFGQFLTLVGGNEIVPPTNPGFGYLTKGSAFAVGAGAGGGPRVKVFTELTGSQSFDFFAYDPSFRGGVRVAMADLNGDGIPDIVTAPGPGFPPLVRVFDGRTLGLITEFMAFDKKWVNGVNIAAADVSRNGVAMIVAGADAGGGPHVRVFDLATGKVIDQFFPYPEQFTGGVRVALGDVNGDRIPDLIVAPGPSQPGALPLGPTVKVFDGRNRNMITEFNAYDPRWQNGVWVAAGDITRNGRAEIFTGADAGGGPHVRVFNGANGQPLSELFPFPKQFTGGVRIAVCDVNNDGILDFVCAPGPMGGGFGIPPVRVFDGRNKRPIGEFIPFEPTFRGGAYVGAN